MRSVVTELVDGGGQIKTDTSTYIQISGDDNNVIFKSTGAEKTIQAQIYGFL